MCREDIPISFNKGNKLIVAFLRNFEKIINSSDKCPSYVLVNLLKKISLIKNDETLSSLNKNGFKVSNIVTSTSFFSEFYNEIQDFVYIAIIFLLSTIFILIIRYRHTSDCSKNQQLKINIAESNDQHNHRNVPIKIEDKENEITEKILITADANVSEFRRFNVVASAPIFELENEVKHCTLYPKIIDKVKDYCNCKGFCCDNRCSCKKNNRKCGEKCHSIQNEPGTKNCKN